MYNSHYNYIMKKFQDCKLLFTDTESFCYTLPLDDLDNTFKEDRNIFDFSSYPEDNDNFSLENKRVPGKFKDEVSNMIILDFFGLRAKTYSILLENEDSKSAVKGVSKVVAKEELTHVMFRNF